MGYVSSVERNAFPVAAEWNTTKKNRRNKSAYNEQGENDNYERYFPSFKIGYAYDINCKWEPFRKQILMQWPRLTTQEVDHVWPNCKYLAQLIHDKYDVDTRMIENYLRNFERTLPLI